MRRLALLLIVCLLLCGCGSAQNSGEPAPVQTPPSAAPSAPLPTAPVHPYEPLRVCFDGLLTDRGYVRNGVFYLSPETVCAYYGMDCETMLSGEGFTLRLPALTVTGEASLPWFEADGRYLYAPEGWIEEDGRLYLPADAIERLFGLTVTAEGSRAEVGSTGYRLLRGGEDYYARTTQADDLFWLTHIIYAEAHHESLACQIGVGNVVLNRVKSPDFPATIMAVVLDREHTLQFEPVGTGEVTAQPDEMAEIAAYLCLEGYNTVDGSLYFVNPERGDPSWFERALTKVCTIDHLHFYK